MRFAVLLCLALSLMACSSELTSSEGYLVEADLSGAVRIPLQTTGADGVTYRLEGATFDISGAAMVTLNERDAAPGKEELASPLPMGGYSLFLRPGYRVVAIAKDGTVTPTSFELATPNPLSFEVGPMGQASVQLEFKHEGQALAFGGSAPVRVTSAAFADEL